MGYNTDFNGVLKFQEGMTVEQLSELKKYLGEDCRDHPEWDYPNVGLTYVDLEITDDMLGLRWNGTEKTYDLVEKINLITKNMRVKYPDFKLSGEMNAQGEDIGDIWKVVMDEDGIAQKVEMKLEGDVVECPHCGENFIL